MALPSLKLNMTPEIPGRLEDFHLLLGPGPIIQFNTSEIGNLSQLGVKRKNVWNHHPVIGWLIGIPLLDHFSITEMDNVPFIPR